MKIGSTYTVKLCLISEASHNGATRLLHLAGNVTFFSWAAKLEQGIPCGPIYPKIHCALLIKGNNTNKSLGITLLNVSIGLIKVARGQEPCFAMRTGGDVKREFSTYCLISVRPSYSMMACQDLF